MFIWNKMEIIMIHGCPSNKEKSMSPTTRTYDKHWIPWIREQLEQRNVKVFTPLMPEPWRPYYANWKREFEKLDVDDESVLIGHSCGCAFLVRWLGETNRKIKKLILVAPWKIPFKKDGSDKDFYNYEINEDIKNNINEIVIFTSNDEAEDGKKSVVIFGKILEAKIIELKNKGHYTQGDMGTIEFPELLETILE